MTFFGDDAAVFAVPPKIAPFEFSSEAKQAGGFTQVICLVSEGDMPVRFQWTFHGGREQATEGPSNGPRADGVTTTSLGPRSSMLTIDNVSAAHSGAYACSVANSAGKAVHVAHLLVNG